MMCLSHLDTFHSNEKVKMAVNACVQESNLHHSGIFKLLPRCDRCISVLENYAEKQWYLSGITSYISCCNNSSLNFLDQENLAYWSSCNLWLLWIVCTVTLSKFKLWLRGKRRVLHTTSGAASVCSECLPTLGEISTDQVQCSEAVSQVTGRHITLQVTNRCTQSM